MCSRICINVRTLTRTQVGERRAHACRIRTHSKSPLCRAGAQKKVAQRTWASKTKSKTPGWLKAISSQLSQSHCPDPIDLKLAHRAQDQPISAILQAHDSPKKAMPHRFENGCWSRAIFCFSYVLVLQASQVGPMAGFFFEVHDGNLAESHGVTSHARYFYFFEPAEAGGFPLRRLGGR